MISFLPSLIRFISLVDQSLPHRKTVTSSKILSQIQNLSELDNWIAIRRNCLQKMRLSFLSGGLSQLNKLLGLSFILQHIACLVNVLVLIYFANLFFHSNWQHMLPCYIDVLLQQSVYHNWKVKQALEVEVLESLALLSQNIICIKHRRPWVDEKVGHSI